MAFTSPIDLSRQTRHTRYSLIRNGGSTRWVLGYEECLPQYAIDRPRGFPFWTLELIVRGNGSAKLRETTVPLSSGTFFTYSPGEPISFRSGGEPMTKYFLTALSDEVWRNSWLGQIPSAVVQVVPGELSGQAMLERILTPGPALGHDREALAECMLEGFAAWLLASGRPIARNQASDLVERAFQLLEARFKELASVTDWAERLGVSQSHLCRAFKKHHHKTPYAELTDRKLQHAYRRLSQSRMSVQEVASEVGYDDPFHFSRLFKRRVGFPPSQAR